jgi:hypothetical protein
LYCLTGHVKGAADYISAEIARACRFTQRTDETIHFIEKVESVAMAPVTLIGTEAHSGRAMMLGKSFGGIRCSGAGKLVSGCHPITVPRFWQLASRRRQVT